MPLAANLHLGHDGQPLPDALYVRIDHDQLMSTLHSQGAWQEGEQHLAPASALLIAEIERRFPSDKLISRASFDILGVIYSGKFHVDVEVLRPGRTIELIEATMRHGDRVSIRARVWRLIASDTQALAGTEWSRLPPPDDMPALGLSGIWPGGFIRMLEARQQATARPGRGASWLRCSLPLVAGEADPATAAFIKVVDAANGLVVRANPAEAFFANVDLSVHLVRQPTAGWVGLDTQVSFGPSGLGETFSVLSDVYGPVGTAAQSLTLRQGRT